MTRHTLLLIRIGLFAFACATLAFWYHALFIESSDLELKAETHMRMIEERREETKKTQHQIHLLEREVAQLKVDSELSSLLARTAPLGRSPRRVTMRLMPRSLYSFSSERRSSLLSPTHDR